MEGIRRRDPAALASLYDRHASIVLAVCQRILRSPVDAEDVLEEVFFEVWQRADRFDPKRGSSVVYLLTVARSRAIDRKRQQTRRSARIVLREDPNPSEPVGPPEGEASPYGDTVAREQARRVRDALASLDPRVRRVVELSFFEGWTHREIALQLSEPIGTIKTRIRRGLLQLRPLLGGLEDDGETM